MTWSVKNSTGQFILAHKGILTSYVDKERYKLTQENTALEITQLKLSDSGMYSCDLITLASGQRFFSAKVLLDVTGKWWVEPLPLLVICLDLSCMNLFFLAQAITVKEALPVLMFCAPLFIYLHLLGHPCWVCRSDCRYLPYSIHFSELMPIIFTRKRTKHKNTWSAIFV